MSHDDKIKYMEIAANLCKFHFKTKDLDLLISLYELVIDKEGDANLKDVAKIEADLNERYKQAPVVIPNNETHTPK